MGEGGIGKERVAVRSSENATGGPWETPTCPTHSSLSAPTAVGSTAGGWRFTAGC